MTQIIYQRSKGLKDVETHYCPGCHHGIIHKLIAEVLVEMDLLDTAVGVSPVGCSVLAGNYLDCDFVEAAHGRAPAVATGIKRVLPNHLVFTYQGDGDLASIGAGEIVHATARGEHFTTIFINNAIYGMTGGQMAPTTLLGQKTTTSQSGRDPLLHGRPVRMAEMLSTLDGMAYCERVTAANMPELNKAKRAIKKAFTLQMQGIGHTFVEVLSACPTNWGMSPADASAWVKSTMSQVYPLGVKKDITAEEKP
ncbi:MAG: thiamine pyrophosphate-dependent enzyme [Bacillota bacterium]|nr:thiamine pyrophosphate-dependent enzyme [Bacillota bacterium]